MIETDPQHLVGQSITVVGLAEDAHQGALVTLSDGSDVYVGGLPYWNKALLKKRVRVTGLLRRDKLAPDPEVDGQLVSHGMFGSALVLENATWEEHT